MLPFPLPPHRTGRADLPHPALRRALPAGPRTRPTTRPSPARTALSTTAKPLAGLADLAVNPLVVGCFQRAPEVRPLPSPGITRFQQYYEPVRHPSAARPVPRGRPVESALSPLGPPVLRSSSYANMPSPLPRRDRRWDRVAPLKSTTAAFPICPLGRLPHYLFRGLFGVHLRYGLPARGVANATLYIEGSGSFVTSATAPIATGWSNSCQVGLSPTEKRRLCTAHGHA
jgi:hypothetical protein